VATGVGRNHPICLGQLRSRTDEYVRRASAGETFHVVRRGQLVARIEALVSVDRSANSKGADRQVVVRARLTDLRHSAGRFLDRVAAGEIIEIIVRGAAVARIVSAQKYSDPPSTLSSTPLM